MKRLVIGAMVICMILWAQIGPKIMPEPASTLDNKLCCGRPVKPSEVKPERIEPETKPQSKLSEGWAFIVLKSEDPLRMNEILHRLEKEGINTNGLRWPPHCALIRATKEDEAKILKVEGIEAIYFESVNPEDIPYKDDLTNAAINYWNRLLTGEFDETIPVPGLEPPKNDMLIPPQNYRYQSDYMFGTVSACIFFPESDGSIDPNLEDWTTTLRNNVINEVSAGLQRWVTWASNEVPSISLSFSLYYYDYTQLPTGYEPISRPQSDEGLWINDCMDAIGAPAGSYFSRVSWFNEWLRSNYGTDWAFSIFVANSLNDGDGCFADGYSAYAYLGGPFQVMTYDNDGYGIGNMDWVCAHETGHNFYAFDEYAASGCYCTQSQNGYQNQNCANNCATNNTCVMRNALETPVEYYTKGHIGWDPGVYTLSDDVTQSLGYPYPKARKYQYNQSVIYWAATGVRPNAGSDWNIMLYSDTNFGTQLASSTYGGTTVDFVVADYNHSPTGVDAIYVTRYSGTSGATIEYEDGTESFSYPNSYSTTWSVGDVVEIFDYYVGSAPINLNFRLDITSGNADLGFGIFSSSGSAYYAARSGMVASADANGAGGDETFDYNVPANDYYGIIVWANYISSASYTLIIGQVGIAEKSGSVPEKEFGLDINPNPCKEYLHINWIINSTGEVPKLKVFDAAGKLVKEFSITGNTAQLVWNLKGDNGKRISDGVYFVSLENSEHKEIEKLILVK